MAFLLTYGSVSSSALDIETNVSEPCHYFDTVPIDLNKTQHDAQTGVIFYNNVKYEMDQFGWFDYVYVNGIRKKSDRHLRGCLSKVLIGACFRICQDDFDANIPIPVELENKTVYLPTHQLVYGRPCAQMYSSNGSDLQLKKDGTVYDLTHNISINHEFYCLNVDNNVVVSTLLCLPEPLKCDLLQTTEIVNNDYHRLPNDSIIYKNLMFTKSQWGFVASTEHEDRGKNLRVCYCEKVDCIRLCCPPGHIGDKCTQHTNENFEIIKEMKFGQNGTKLVNLKDDTYKHQLVYGNVCSPRFEEEEDEKFELLSDGRVAVTTVDNTLLHLNHHMYCIRANENQEPKVVIEYCISAIEDSTKMPVPLVTNLPLPKTTENLALRSTVIDSSISEPCHYIETVPIDVDNTQHDPQTGVLTFNNVEYEKDQFGWFNYVYVNGSRVEHKRHLRACLCKALKGACVRICQENLDPKNPITVEIENLTKDQLVYGKPCAQMHPGNKTHMELKPDGTMYDGEHKISINHEFYCLNVEENVIVSILLCKPQPPECDSLQTTEILNNDYHRLPNDSIIYKNLTFTQSQWGLVERTDHEDRGKNLRVCYCDKVDCIRLCCPQGFIGENCDQQADILFEINKEVKFGDNSKKLVNLNDGAFKDRLVYRTPCSPRIEEDPSEEFELLSNGSLYLKTDDNTIEHYSHTMYCLRAKNGSNMVTIEYCVRNTENNFLYSAYLPYCMVFSVPFLVVTFLIYALIPELRNMNGKCLMFYVSGMIVYSITLSVTNLTEPTSSCQALGYISYFALMMSFFWVNVMCFDIWFTFRRIWMSREQLMQFFYYICYGIGGPMIMVTIVAIVDSSSWESMRPRIGEKQCFFESNGNGEMAFLFVPIGVLISTNICFFVASYSNIQKAKTSYPKDNNSRRHSLKNEDTESLVLCVRLITIMGLTWSMEVISWIVFKITSKHSFFFTFFDVFNCLQGVWIFLLFICKKKVFHLVRKRWNRFCGIPYVDNVSFSTTRRTAGFNNQSSVISTCKSESGEKK